MHVGNVVRTLHSKYEMVSVRIGRDHHRNFTVKVTGRQIQMRHGVRLLTTYIICNGDRRVTFVDVTRDTNFTATGRVPLRLELGGVVTSGHHSHYRERYLNHGSANARADGKN